MCSFPVSLLLLITVPLSRHPCLLYQGCCGGLKVSHTLSRTGLVFWLFILVLLCPRGASLQVPHPLLPLDLSISPTPSGPSPHFSGMCLSVFPCGVASYQARLPPASPKSLDLFANQFNICEAEIIIVTYFTGGLMRINSLMSTEVFEDGTCYLRAKRYY